MIQTGGALDGGGGGVKFKGEATRLFKLVSCIYLMHILTFSIEI